MASTEVLNTIHTYPGLLGPIRADFELYGIGYSAEFSHRSG